MIIVSVKAPAPPPPPPAKCLCTVAEVAVLKEPVVVVKPPDAEVDLSLPAEQPRVVVAPPSAEIRTSALEVGSVEVKPADVRSDITLGVSVSVTVS